MSTERYYIATVFEDPNNIMEAGYTLSDNVFFSANRSDIINEFCFVNLNEAKSIAMLFRDMCNLGHILEEDPSYPIHTPKKIIVYSDSPADDGSLQYTVYDAYDVIRHD